MRMALLSALPEVTQHTRQAESQPAGQRAETPQELGLLAPQGSRTAAFPTHGAPCRFLPALAVQRQARAWRSSPRATLSPPLPSPPSPVPTPASAQRGRLGCPPRRSLCNPSCCHSRATTAELTRPGITKAPLPLPARSANLLGAPAWEREGRREGGRERANSPAAWAPRSPAHEAKGCDVTIGGRCPASSPASQRGRELCSRLASRSSPQIKEKHTRGSAAQPSCVSERRHFLRVQMAESQPFSRSHVHISSSHRRTHANSPQKVQSWKWKIALSFPALPPVHLGTQGEGACQVGVDIQYVFFLYRCIYHPSLGGKNLPRYFTTIMKQSLKSNPINNHFQAQ